MDYLDAAYDAANRRQTWQKRVRRNHSEAFKVKVAFAALRDEKTLNALAVQFDLHANQIKHWKDQLLDRAEGVFGATGGHEPAAPVLAHP